MPFIKVYIHFVWSTKNRYPFLHTKEIRQQVWQHIKDNALKKEIFIDFINGHADHCHCLVSLGSDQTMEKVMQLIKGESAYWINKQPGLLSPFDTGKFGWQNDYFAIAVSDSQLDHVRNYIKNQEEHHSQSTFQEEYDQLIPG
mgnify:CR=1 FL=1